ncbi:Gfo/Idh/MocA family protein [Lysobacter korlensis]|uniref:Gfo/Idh/MocA family protein n=1 Tax=Lysobacter korlensis TaxID=553636 RepID=A0ABV6RVR5_9GAMM
MIRVGVVGVGKMGMSHLSMIRAHPGVEVAAVCDATGYVLDVLGKYTGLRTFTDYGRMLDSIELDAVVISTPTASHYALVNQALDRGLHVFCEKPLSLSAAQSEELAARAADLGLVTQVGYHNRFVGAFQEVKRLLDSGVIGEVSHVLAESYGPVVLKPKGSTWRSKRETGGGSLYDYAAHPLDLLSWFLGEPVAAGGTVLGRIFSAETDDEVYSTLFYEGGTSAQLSVNWSDESQRKMTTKITIWGSKGKIAADRQECQLYLRDTAEPPAGYEHGWNVRYTTELTQPVWFYLRGEEYSAQLAYFVESIAAVEVAARPHRQNSFGSASVTDRAIELLIADADAGSSTPVGRAEPQLAAAGAAAVATAPVAQRLGWLRRTAGKVAR